MLPKKRQTSEKMIQIMHSLGCEEVRPGVFRHPDINFDFDMSATADDKIVLRLMQIFSNNGYECFRSELRDLIGL